MHRPSVSQLVFSKLWPRRKDGDGSPPSFSQHITRHLVPEVRTEIQCFYGALDCIEAQYPGLDYTFRPHRMRLSRFPHHRRLFKAFDELDLTPNEILSLCRWEGTKSARDRYEAENRTSVRDTTGDEISVALPNPRPVAYRHSPITGTPRKVGGSSEEGYGDINGEHDLARADTEGADEEGSEDEEEEEEEVESYGVELNQRLMAVAEARDRGDDVVVDEQWEQWMKEALERDGAENLLMAIRAGIPYQPTTTAAASSSSASASASAATAPVNTAGTAFIQQQMAAMNPSVTAPTTTANPPAGAAR